MSGEAPGVWLPWDSEFFGCRIGRVAGATLSPERVAALDAWCDAERIDGLYFLASAADSASVEAAEDAGFHLVDVRLSLEQRIAAPGAGAPPLDAARAADGAALQAIARDAHTDSRFFADPCLRHRAADLYAVWIERSLEGRARAVLVERDESGEPQGYVTCEEAGAGAGAIGLLGVAAPARGRGVGRRLVAGALAWLAGAGLPTVRVVTQGRNLAAQRLYLRQGFLPARVELWLHRWRSRPPA